MDCPLLYNLSQMRLEVIDFGQIKFLPFAQLSPTRSTQGGVILPEWRYLLSIIVPTW